jgi:CTP synthase
VSNVPFLGICFGMQLAAIEAARAAGVLLATSTEFCADTISPVVSLLNEQGAVTDLGGTARRGAHPVSLVAGGYAREIYGREDITERFRHRYEVNARRYKAALAGGGLIVTGVTHVAGITDLPAVMENPSHPWFLATQFHPELKSRPMDPHPLFVSLITAAVKK